MTGCTLWPDRKRNHKCCDQHDAAYRHGVPRRYADRELLICLLEHGYSASLAVIMWMGVRLAGWAPYLWHRIKEKKNG